MSDIALAYDRVESHRISKGGVAGVLAAHFLVGWVLVSLDVVPNPLDIKPLMVQMLAQPPAVSPPTPPKPQTSVKTPRPSAPVKQAAVQPTLAAQTQAASGDVQERQVVEPLPPVRAAPAEVAVSQPRFDANYLDNPAPTYPPLSRRMGEEGKVFLRVFVEPDGRPSAVEIKTSSGSPRLDQAAENAVRRWKFIPAKRGNEAVSAWVVVPISFNLKG